MSGLVAQAGLALALAGAFTAVGYLLVVALSVDGAPDDRLDLLEACFAAVALAFCMAGLLGIALVELGLFSVPLLTLLLLMLATAVGLRQWRRWGTVRWRVAPVAAREWSLLTLLGLLALLLFFRPHELITGGSDAGVYVNIGANIAQTGALLIHEPVLAGLDPALTPGLLRVLPAWEQSTYLRFPGFFRADGEPDLVIPQFFTLHPLWIGVAYWLGGVRAGLLAAPFWALLGVWALYMAARRVFGVTVAWFSAFLLMIVPLQLYFARYPTAEPLSQYLTWLSIWAFTAWATERAPRRLWGMTAALAIGSLFLARIDMIFVLFLPVGWGLHLALTRRRPSAEGWFWLPLVLTGAYAAFHALVFSGPYTLNTYGSVFQFLWAELWSVALVVLLIGGVLLYLGTVQRPRLLRWARAAAGSSRTHHAAAALLVVLALYGYFLRPLLGETVWADYWYSATEVPLAEHLNLVRLGWYLSPLGLALAVAGGVLMLETGRWRVLWPVWTVGGSFTLLYVYNILNNPFQIYAMRRYLPVTVPFLILGAAYALVWLWRRPRPWLRVVAVLLFLVLTGWLLYNSRLIGRQIDYAGSLTQTAELAARFEPDAILLFVDDLPVGVGVVLGTPLQYIHGLTAFDLQEEELDPARLLAQVDRWQTNGRPVYLVVKEGQPILLPTTRLAHTGRYVWDTPYLEQSYDHRPAAVERSRFVLELFRITAGDRN